MELPDVESKPAVKEHTPYHRQRWRRRKGGVRTRRVKVWEGDARRVVVLPEVEEYLEVEPQLDEEAQTKVGAHSEV